MSLLVVASACVPREREPGAGSEKPAARAAAPKTTTQVASALPGEGGAVRAEPAGEGGLDDPLLEGTFVDEFERKELGPDWRTTSSAWRIQSGWLCAAGAKNHPVWLKRRLPVNARVEFDAVSYSADGDIKAEIWGDGRSAASGVSYSDATSYIAIFGGWRNQFHVLARLDEHAPDRRQIALLGESDDFKRARVNEGQVYRFKIERRDSKTVRWFVDDMEVLSYADDQPLRGVGHEHFGFNNWQVRICFDNLRASPAGG